MNDLTPENMSIKMDHSNRSAVFKQWGVMNKQVVLDSYKYIYEDKEFDPSYGYIVDYRNVSRVDLSVEDIKNVLKEARKIDKLIDKSALVTGNSYGRYVLAKLYCTLSSVFAKEKVQRQAFQRMEDAEAWMNSDSKK